MTNEQVLSDLKECGFNEGSVGEYLTHDGEWTKTVKNSVGSQYVVVVRFWRHTKYARPGLGAKDGWDCDAHFRLPKDEYFRVNRTLCDRFGVRDLEPWLSGVWTRLGCDYLSRNEESADVQGAE